MNFLKISVCASYVALIIYTVVVLILNNRGIEVSDTLTQYFFIVFGVEFASQAAIQIAKNRIKKDEVNDKIETLKENNFPIEKEDLNAKTGEVDFDQYYGGGPYG